MKAIKCLVAMLMIVGMIGCGEVWLRPPADYGNIILPMPPGSRYDCGVFLVGINGEWGVETVFTMRQDMETMTPGIQFEVNMELRGNHAKGEVPRLLVNGVAHTSTKLIDGTFLVNVSLTEPTIGILLQGFSTLKVCYSGTHLSTVDFGEW